MLLVPSDPPYNTLSEVIQAVTIKASGFCQALVGVSTLGHLAAVALALGAKLNMVHVPYQGLQHLFHLT